MVLLAMIGKCFNCVAFQLAYLYASELYCTSLRAIGLMTCSAMARLGSVLGAYVILLVSTLDLYCMELVFVSRICCKFNRLI